MRIIPHFLVTLEKNILSFLLAFLISQSFSLAIFSKTLKIAKVLSIFKKANVKNISNYCPISLLSSILKIYESAIYNRTVSLVLAAIIFLLPINLVLEKVIPQVMPSLT